MRVPCNSKYHRQSAADSSCFLQRNSEFVTHLISRYLWRISVSPEQAVGLATLLSHGRASPLPIHPDFWPTSNLLTFPFTTN